MVVVVLPRTIRPSQSYVALGLWGGSWRDLTTILKCATNPSHSIPLGVVVVEGLILVVGEQVGGDISQQSLHPEFLYSPHSHHLLQFSLLHLLIISHRLGQGAQ